ncbi:MAG: glycosyl transferase [Bacteroidetes bacterium]|nr:glycosyl transferase [Bacteroidota bacterium]
MSKIIKVIKNPRKAIRFLLNNLLKSVAPLIKDDTLYIKLKWKLSMDYPLNLDNPTTFSEKLQWLKLHDHNPDYIKMVDKVEAKKYVASIIGEEFIIPTIGVYNTVEEINFDELPNQFVLKCTHDSNGMVICKDKKTFDIDRAKEKLKKGLGQSYYCLNREWPYKNVKPRIIAEQFMSEDEQKAELKDYKWFCFNGEPEYLFIATDRFTNGEQTKFDFYDSSFNHLPIINGHPNASVEIKKPESFEHMKEIAARLSQNIPHVRVDLYDIKGKIYFGELTFYHWSGFMPFDPHEWDVKFGELITMPHGRE